MHGASADVGSPLRWFTSLAPLVGGLQVARWIHHVVMWLLLGFAVHHVYSGVLMSTIEANATMESIFSGYKFVPRKISSIQAIDSSTARGRSMNERIPLLVLGLGNVLLEDDGVGGAAVALLLDRFEPPRRCSRLRRRHAWPVAAAVSRDGRRRDSRRCGQSGRRARHGRAAGRRRRRARGRHPPVAASGRRRGSARWRALAGALSRARGARSVSFRNRWNCRSGSSPPVRASLPDLVDVIVRRSRGTGFCLRAETSRGRARSGCEPSTSPVSRGCRDVCRSWPPHRDSRRGPGRGLSSVGLPARDGGGARRPRAQRRDGRDDRRLRIRTRHRAFMRRLEDSPPPAAVIGEVRSWAIPVEPH